MNSVGSIRSKLSNNEDLAVPYEVINKILNLICKIQLKNFVVRDYKEYEWEIKTELIDFLISKTKYNEDDVSELIRRFKSIRFLNPKNTISNLLKFMFGSNKYEYHDFTDKNNPDYGNIGLDKKQYEIKLDKNNKKRMLCNHVSLIYEQLVELMSKIERSKPSYREEYFMKHCLTNYDEVLKKEIFDIHEVNKVNLVCDRRELIEFLYKYCFRSGYKLSEVIMIPLYDVSTKNEAFVNFNYPTMLSILYVSNIENVCKNKKNIENKDLEHSEGCKLMFSLLNVGKYSMIQDGKFESIIPITPILSIRRITIYTATFKKKIENRNNPDDEVFEETKDSIFKCKYSFIKKMSITEKFDLKHQNQLEEWDEVEDNADITILCIQLRGDRGIEYTIHSPFLDEKELTELIKPVFNNICNEHPKVKDQENFKEFLKRCYMHMGSNFIFIN
ncbi:hypothetical protein TpMuguga_01g00764 [Theileria parva strain Muguga]|uniref:Uncharacterized protein n=1 Tax=Theileria parva TaxID=5875 RepID=Q4N7Q6_THEPA|nr:uncharacterized protein TpMuguga_01g00764 [Theileria parva strain Muguga]EAN34002.1 hypothetical protein TpMuguga_01g00764 [Theileria parva strain Muguga]|eukprot:XP_766285.1 hypothetical protein [Theileria parva strain Muguga]